MHDLIRMYWDCPMCGRKGIISTERRCSCGYVFGTEAGDEFRMPLPGEKIEDVPDPGSSDELIENWRCDYCGAYNRHSSYVCRICGHPRDESSKGYFAVTGIEKSSVSRSISDGDIYEGSQNIYEDLTKSGAEIEAIVKGEALPPNEDGAASGKAEDNRSSSKPKRNNAEAGPGTVMAYGRYDQAELAKSKEKMREKRLAKEKERNERLAVRQEELERKRREASLRRRKILLKTAGIAAVLLLVIAAAAAYFLIPHEETFRVTGKSWERSVDIEIEKTYSESGWTLPSGARLNYTATEIRSYRSVLDHYETVTVTKYKSVPRTETYYEDLGNGNARKQTRTVYDEVPYTTTEEEPVYRDVPVYDTKYYYEIDRYVYERSVKSSGLDDEPYWGEIHLGEKERRGDTHETYRFLFEDGGDEKSVAVDREIWDTVQAGSAVTLMKNRAGMYQWPEKGGS